MVDKPDAPKPDAPKPADPKPAPDAKTDGLKGLKGLHTGPVEDVDPFTAAKAKAPSLTKEFVAAYKMTDDDLMAIGNGSVSPPPTIGPAHTSDLYLTPGGWQQTPPGVPPEDVGKDAISR